jgi:3-deoxy-manno-octulosonate cytidylyltransferase (CMP-KDO synthetase)
MLNDDSVKCATLKMKIQNPVDLINGTITKVVNDINENILFLSRSPIPYPKASTNYEFYKHIGLYAYHYDILENYMNMPIGFLEKAEDIEILRLIENGIKVKVKEVVSESIAVDTEMDLERVREFLMKN